MDTLAPNAPHFYWLKNCFCYTVKTNTGAGSCWKPHGPPTQMAMGGNSFLTCIFYEHTQFCLSEHLQGQSFSRWQIRKPTAFCLVTKKGGICIWMWAPRRTGNECVLPSSGAPPADWPHRTSESLKGLGKAPSPAHSTLSGRQNPANALHQEEHLLLLPLPPLSM